MAILLTALLVGAVVHQLIDQARVAQEARRLNLVAFDEAWELVRDEHFDPDLGGIDWRAVREELRPRMAETRSRDQGREVLEEMLQRLGQSHFALIGSEAMSRQSYEKEAGAAGLDLRIVDGRALVTSVAQGSAAQDAGVRPGWLLTAVGGRDIATRIADLERDLPAGSRRPVQVTDGIRRLLFGPLGSTLRLQFEDGDGAPRPMTLILGPPAGRLAQAGQVPAGYVEMKAERREHDIAYVSLSGFIYPAFVMRQFNEAMAHALDARGLVVDLRGNGGGMLEMVTGMLGWLVTEHHSIGTMVFRQSEVDVAIWPRTRSYAGPVAVLIDEVCLSGAELFAHAIRVLDRGILVGSTTSGSVQGGRIERLATGDALMFVVSDFRTPADEILEGMGVAPDLEV